MPEPEASVKAATAAQRASFYAGRCEHTDRLLAEVLASGCLDAALASQVRSVLTDPWPSKELALLEHNARLRVLVKDQRAALKRANAALVANGLQPVPFTRTPPE